MNVYTFIFEITYRDPDTGLYKPHEYRKKNQMTIVDARRYAHRLANMHNIVSVKFYKEMY